MNVAGGDTAQLAGPDQDRWEVAVAGCAAAGLPWAEEMRALTPLIARLGEQVGELRRQRRPMVISHRDLDPKNAVVTEGGELIITDWDYAGPVVAGVELVTAGSSFARTHEELREFVMAYRDSGGTAEPADDLALSIEVAELDWLLRNVEAVVRDRLGPATETFRTAERLIWAFADGHAELVSWSRRLRVALDRGAS